MNILIYVEAEHDKHDWMKKVYPSGIQGALKEALTNDNNQIRIVTFENITDITEEVLKNTDVTLWWGHELHDKVPDSIAIAVQKAVFNGMGFIALHSSHFSKPFMLLMGSSCTLICRDNDRERLWVVNPTHPIAAGLPPYFELPQEEMYGECFDIPKPDDVIFMGWFAGGEVFRSGCTFSRGYGKVFYFQPGHEVYPIYYDANIIKVINNAVNWAAPTIRLEKLECQYPQSPEAVK